MIRYTKAMAVFFIVFAVGFTIMSGIVGAIRAAHGEEAPPGVRWVTVMTIQAKDGNTVKLVYGTKESGKVTFESKEKCEANKKTDEKLLESVTHVMAVAAERGDKVKSIECQLDDSGEHA